MIDLGSGKVARLARVAAKMALAATLFASTELYGDDGHSTAKVKTLMRQPLLDQPGKDGVLVAIEFAPGHVDAPHRHPGPLFLYVLEGSIEMQMERGELRTLKQGDTFYEKPGQTHGVGRNVSKTEPVKLLVYLIADQNAPLVLPPLH